MAKVTYDKKMRQVMLHSHKIEDIDGLTNPLRFQGEITTDFDSSIISGLDNGWFYTIKTTPSGQTVTDTNTGQVFKDKDEIAWDGAKWVIIGNESEIDSSKWANIDVQFDKGLLYNGFNSSIVDILPSGFSIPSLSVWNDLITIAGGLGTAGQRLKSLLGWTSVYPGDTNDLNFNATGTGVRVTAEFNGESQTTYFLASDTNGAENSGVVFRYDVPNAIVLTAGAGGIPRTHGVSIRGVRSATAEELLLADGSSAGIVKDYDGNYYRTVKIGFNVWMADNLKTTHENDGTPLVQVQDQTAWAALTSPAYCYYNNTDIVILDTIESNYIEPINNRKFSKSHMYDYTETPTSLTNTIFVDATRGDDATADGSIAKPYKTPEAVPESIYISTVAVTRTSGSNLITNIADVDYDNINVGDVIYISSTLCDLYVVSKDGGGVDAKQITISKNSDGGGTGLFRCFSAKKVKLYGNFTIASSLDNWTVTEWDFNGNVIFGNLSAFDLVSDGYVRAVSLSVKFQTAIGTHANSVFVKNSSAAQSAQFLCKIQGNDIYSKGVGRVFNLGSPTTFASNLRCNIDIDVKIETVGSLGKFEFSKVNIRNNYLCTLGGCSAYNCNIIINSNIVETPLSVAVLTLGKCDFNITSNIVGSTSYTLSNGENSIINAPKYYGDTHLFEVDSIVLNAGLSGVVTFNAGAYGISNVVLNITRKAGTGNSLTINNNGVYIIGDISLTQKLGSGGFIIYQNSGIFRANILCNVFRGYVTGGELHTYGYIVNSSNYVMIAVSGGIWKNYSEFEQKVEYSDLFSQSGGIIQNYGKLKMFYPYKHRRLGYITGGKFENHAGRLIVANDMPPLHNEGSSQDISWFGGQTNCDTAITSIETAYGKVIYIRITSDGTDSEFTLNDGSNSETFSVTGSGKTKSQIAEEFVVLINASTLNFHYVSIGSVQTLAGQDIYLIGNPLADISATTITNGTTANLSGLGYTPNFLHKINLVEDPTLD